MKGCLFLRIFISYCVVFCDRNILKDAAEVAVVEEDVPKEDSTMPSEYNMTISLIHDHVEPVRLSLHMNKQMNEQRAIYVLRKNKEGKDVLEKQDIPIQGNVAFYQDETNGANVMITCEGFEQSKGERHCDPLLDGSFYVENVQYELKPLPPESPLRRRRSVRSVKRGKLYVVQRAQQREPTLKPVLTDEAAQAMEMRVRTLNLPSDVTSLEHTPEDPNLFSDMLIPGESSEFKTTMVIKSHGSHSRKYPRQKGVYEIGLIVLVDYSIYQRWVKESTKSDEKDKDIEAKTRIRQYMAHVINGVDLRYKTLKHRDIKILVTQYIIADDPSVSPWTLKRYSAFPRDLVYADSVLNELARWKYHMEPELPVHDHVMLFTGYDLFRPSPDKNGVAGFARVKSMCTSASVSVVEDHGGFGCILTATHELGHSLGAYHDGFNNSCDGEDNFIMTPIGGATTISNALNPFRFSQCTIDAFNDYMDSLPDENCMTDSAFLYDHHEHASHLATPPGQLYGPNEQCKQHLGQDSYYAWGGILGELDEVCTHMACKNDLSNTSFNIYYGVRGTSCGNGKWCMDGLCVPSNDAPRRDPLCVHGDSWRLFGDMTCAQYVREDPSRCYYSYYKNFCCESCKDIKKKIEGCEYGDRKAVCDLVHTEPRLCYNIRKEKTCCETCRQYASADEECKYGDRDTNCVVDGCSDPKYKYKCCKTCASLSYNYNSIEPHADTAQNSLSNKGFIDQTFATPRTPTFKQGTMLQSSFVSNPPAPGNDVIDHSFHTSDKSANFLSQKTSPTQISVTKNPDKEESVQIPPKPENSWTSKKPPNSILSSLTVPKIALQKESIPKPNLRTTERRGSKIDKLKPLDEITSTKPPTTSSTPVNLSRLVEENLNKPATTQSTSTSSSSVGLAMKPPKKIEIKISPIDFDNPFIKSEGNIQLSHRDNDLASRNQLCLKKESSYLMMSCDWLNELMKDLCEHDLFKKNCCEPCHWHLQPKQPDCFDDHDCSYVTGRHCYQDFYRQRCCSSCRKYETLNPKCPYGDRSRHCPLLLRFMPRSTCSNFFDECCESCSKFSEDENPSTVTLSTTNKGVHDPSSTVLYESSQRNTKLSNDAASVGRSATQFDQRRNAMGSNSRTAGALLPERINSVTTTQNQWVSRQQQQYQQQQQQQQRQQQVQQKQQMATIHTTPLPKSIWNRYFIRQHRRQREPTKTKQQAQTSNRESLRSRLEKFKQWNSKKSNNNNNFNQQVTSSHLKNNQNNNNANNRNPNFSHMFQPISNQQNSFNGGGMNLFRSDQNVNNQNWQTSNNNFLNSNSQQSSWNNDNMRFSSQQRQNFGNFIPSFG